MKRLSALGLILTFAALLVAASTAMSSQASPNNQPPRPLGVTNPNHGTRPAGHMPAIQPRQTLVQARQVPTFTLADVNAYLQTDAVAQDAARQHLTRTITFISAQSVGKMINDDFSQDAPILCYVEFTGKQPFTLNEVKSPSPSSMPRFTKAFEVFDGVTGDLLTWGGMP
ncbi:MAG: hypothetical protein ABI324_20735 [Ktedonobacteraceae bacterium]